MNARRSVLVLGWVCAATLALAACNLQPSENRPRATLFIGIDASGSFQQTGQYDDALYFLAHYIYGHLNGLDGLERPRELFVGGIGGRSMGEPKSFHPIHDFEGKEIDRIESDLKEWFPPTDTLTDFNAFVQEVARISKERNLILAPMTVVIVSDGVPDMGADGPKDQPHARYTKIDLGPIEYLSKNVTLRLVYASPKVDDQWRKYVTRQRVRLWAVDAEVMAGWTGQLKEGVEPAGQDRLWKWVKDNVDFRVRSGRV